MQLEKEEIIRCVIFTIFSMVIGGSFKGFWFAACPWALMGIGLSAWAAYTGGQNNNKGENEK